MTTADQVKFALSQKHTKDFFLTEVKTGPTWDAQPGELFKIDAMAIKKSWTSPCFTAYEVKVSRQDFLNDTKYPNYMKYCHLFNFACPKDLIRPEELNKEIGLIYYNDGKLTTKRKALFRPVTIPAPMLYYIILSCIQSDRHPFFTDEDAYKEAYLRHQNDGAELHRKIDSQLAKDIKKYRSEIEKLQREKERMEKDQEDMQEIRSVLTNHGLFTISPVHELERYFNTNENRQMQIGIERILSEISLLQKRFGGGMAKIENDEQLRITQEWADKFREAIANLENQEQTPITEISLNACKSQLESLEREMAEYSGLA